jgi:hypothetical protein
LPPDEPIFHYAYGYCWLCCVGWAFAVVSANSNPKLCVISTPVASCDEDEGDDWTRFHRSVWGTMEHVFRHPFALNYAPHLYYFVRDWNYKSWVECAFNLRVGKMSKEFFDYGEKDTRPPFRFGSLLRSGGLVYLDYADDYTRPPYRLGSLLRSVRLFCRWAFLRINSPVAFSLYSRLQTAAAAARKHL